MNVLKLPPSGHQPLHGNEKKEGYYPILHSFEVVVIPDRWGERAAMKENYLITDQKKTSEHLNDVVLDYIHYLYVNEVRSRSQVWTMHRGLPPSESRVSLPSAYYVRVKFPICNGSVSV